MLTREITKTVAVAEGDFFRSVTVKTRHHHDPTTKKLNKIETLSRDFGDLFRPAKPGERADTQLMLESTFDVVHLIRMMETLTPKVSEPQKLVKVTVSKKKESVPAPAVVAEALPAPHEPPAKPAEAVTETPMPTKKMQAKGAISPAAKTEAPATKTKKPKKVAAAKAVAKPKAPTAPKASKEPKATKATAKPAKAPKALAAVAVAKPVKAAPKVKAPKAAKVAKAQAQAPVAGASGEAPKKPSQGQKGSSLTLTKVNPNERQVLGKLNHGSGPQKITEIAKVFKNAGEAKANSWVRNSLRRLVRGGLVQQVGRGEYKLTAAGKKFESS